MEVGIVCSNIDSTVHALLSSSLTVCYYTMEFNSVSCFLVPCMLSRCWLCFLSPSLFTQPPYHEGIWPHLVKISLACLPQATPTPFNFEPAHFCYGTQRTVICMDSYKFQPVGSPQSHNLGKQEVSSILLVLVQCTFSAWVAPAFFRLFFFISKCASCLYKLGWPKGLHRQ